MALWLVTELSGQDNNLFGLAGAWWFAPGERRGDTSGGAVAFGQTITPRAERGVSGRKDECFFFTIQRTIVFKVNAEVL